MDCVPIFLMDPGSKVLRVIQINICYGGLSARAGPGGGLKKKLRSQLVPTKFEKGLIVWKISMKIIHIPHSFCI